MAGIPEHIIDQVRESTNVLDVVSRYVSLKKRGRNYVGLCPFHTEKTPSFTVNTEKQIFHCFGCGAGGNVFRFLMRYENLSFVDTVKRLAREAGIEIPVSQEIRQQVSKNERLFKANENARTFFQFQLKHAPKTLKDYLKKRGISPKSIELFQVGYAPEGWDHLLKYIQKGNFSQKPYQKLGLLLTGEKSGKLYDRFRNRLMFPIHNPSGKVVGFGGRQLDDNKNSPKYINSPESPVYQKSRVLYGLYFAREAIRESGFTIFVEGYMDVIQLYQSGVQNVVATSGTALTEDHARLIRRYSNRVFLCYDADKAGVNAAVRGGEVLFQQNIDAEVLILPEGEDPDSYVRQHGKAAFLALLKTAPDYLSFRLTTLQQRYNMQTATERSSAVNEIMDMLAPMNDAVRVGFYIEKIAEKFSISQEILVGELKKKQRAARKRERFGIQQQAAYSAQSGDTAAAKPGNRPLVFSGAWGGEKDVILLLLNYFEDYRAYIFDHLDEADFQNLEFRNIFSFIRQQPDDVGENLIHHVFETVESEELRALLMHEVFHSNREFSNPGLYLQGCIKQIKIAVNQAKIDLAKRAIKELSPDDKKYFELLAEMQSAMNTLKKWQDVVPSQEKE